MTADTVGGVWTFAVELARALQPHGVHVSLATMGGWMSHHQRAEVLKLTNVEVFESRFRLEWMDGAWENVYRAGEWLRKLENRVAPDLIHLNGYAHGNLNWQTPTVITGHSCVLSWWKAVKGEPASGQWDLYRTKVRAGLQSASLVVAPTRAMLSSLEEHYGPLRETIVVPNGRDPGRFAPGDKEPCIVAAGRLWDEAKNIAAVDALASRLPWPVYVAGEDRHPNGHPNGADFQKNGAHMLGRLSAGHLAHWFARAAIYVHPARYEPFGLCVLEAALSGCALVLGDIPSLRENWDGAALFVDPNDPEALQQALNALIHDEELRARLAAIACARGMTFAPECMAEGYLAAYRSVMCVSSKPSRDRQGAFQEGVRSCA